MRTTITLDDDVREFATVYSSARGMGLSAAINELVRKAEKAAPAEPVILTSEDGIPLFPPTGKTLKSETVKRLAEDHFGPQNLA